MTFFVFDPHYQVILKFSQSVRRHFLMLIEIGEISVSYRASTGMSTHFTIIL